jgi:hypothetical protein
MYDDAQCAMWNAVECRSCDGSKAAPKVTRQPLRVLMLLDLQKALSSRTAFLGVAPNLAVATTYFHEAFKDGTAWNSEREGAYRTWKDSTRYGDPRDLVLPQYRMATLLVSGTETYRNTIDALGENLSRSFRDRSPLANRASGFSSRTAPK